MLQILPMFLEDIPEMLKIEQSSHEHPWHRESFLEELNRSYSYVWTAKIQHTHTAPPIKNIPVVAGYICFWKVADEIQILNLAVHPDHRRRGIGRSLLSHALKKGHELQGRIAILEVSQSNEAARWLYRSLGFLVVGERPRYYNGGPKGGAILMELEMGS